MSFGGFGQVCGEFLVLAGFDDLGRVLIVFWRVLSNLVGFVSFVLFK